MRISIFIFVAATLIGCSPTKQNTPANGTNTSTNNTKAPVYNTSTTTAEAIDDAQSTISSATETPDNWDGPVPSRQITPEELASGQWLTTAGAFYISDIDRIKVEEDARNGDAEAAFRLAKFYRYSSENPKMENYWLRVSANNGNLVAKHNLAFNLIEARIGVSEAEKQEGWKLMQECADAGYNMAILYLRDNKRP